MGKQKQRNKKKKSLRNESFPNLIGKAITGAVTSTLICAMGLHEEIPELVVFGLGIATISLFILLFPLARRLLRRRQYKKSGLAKCQTH